MGANVNASQDASLKKKLARRASAKGMTLIEIMVVLVILGLIAGAISVSVFGQLKEANIRAAKLDLKALEQALDLYHVETSGYPDGLGQLTPKYTKEIHKDPWGMDYVYVRSGESFEIYSYGPDKSQGGGDDISVHGGANGSASGG